MPGIATVTIHEQSWQVSLASTLAELSQGLGGLESIPDNTGMLFDLGAELIIYVTTEPMLFDIDIAFIGADLVVTEVHRLVAPGNMVISSLPARYFMEVNAGEFDAIEPGDSVLVEVLSTTGPQYTFQDLFIPIIPFVGIAILGSGMVGVVKAISR